MAELRVKDSSDSDDNILYSINSDSSAIDSSDIEGNSLSDELDLSSEADDNSNVMNNKQRHESWSGNVLKCNLPCYDGELKLSIDSKSKIPRNASPIDFFRLYFTPKFATYIVDQSNLYRIQTNKLQQAPMSEDDLNCLLGFLFYSSVVPLPNKRDYWSSFSRQPVLADVITRDRIMYLLSILHFHDNAIEKHKLEKIEPILKYFNQQSKVIVEPENNLIHRRTDDSI